MKKLLALSVLLLSISSCGHMMGCKSKCSSHCDMKKEDCSSCKEAKQCPMKEEAKTEEVKK